AGMESRIDTVCDVLEEIFHPDAIIARNDSPLRALEHLPQATGTLRGTAATADVIEHGIQYHVDLLQGQKTGLFLDQKMNRHLLRRFVRGRRVLDCFCNDGGFSMNAAVGGATSVEGVDISAPSVDRATDNARRNGISQVQFEQGDVFEALRNRSERAERYGAIVLDPPSFTKNKKTVASALHGYRTINTLALRLLEPDGILLSASCSHHIDSHGFLDMIRESALKADRSVQLLDFRGASPDHPVLPAMPETGYLKLAVIAVT
ncbi:MAG: class I SAM-dependent rRNA methyltransferase, partial [Bacteroidota bacterium]